MSETADELEPFPEEGPASLPAVKLRLKLDEDDEDDDAELEDLVDAVNVLVRRWPVAEQARGEDAWPEDVILGANMLAARLWRRKDTSGGVEIFGDGGFAYVRRNDPDIAMLLGLAEWAKPAVG